jgi:outer membrane protein
MNYKSFFLLFAGIFSFFLLSAQEAGPWSLERCIDHALDQNLMIKQAELNVESETLNLGQSRRNRLPDLGGAATAAFNRGFSINPVDNQVVRSNSYFTNYSVSGGVSVYAGRSLTNTIEKREIDLLTSRTDLQQAEYDMVLSVATGFLSVLFNEEILKNARTQIESTREQRERTSKLVKAGSLPKASLYDLDAQIATEELAIVNSENQLQLAKLNLRQMLLIEDGEPFEIERPDFEDFIPLLPLLGPTEIYEAAESSFPSIRSADLRIQSLEKDVEIAKAQKLPSLSAWYQFNTRTSSLSKRVVDEQITQVPIMVGIPDIGPDPITLLFPSTSFTTETYPYFSQFWDNRGFAVGLSLNVPLYNKGQVTTNTQLADIGVRNARIGSQLQRQQLKQSIEQAYLDVRSAYGSFLSVEKQIEALEVAFENSEKQLNLGTINATDFTLAKNNLNRARVDLLRAKYDFIFKSKILDFYLGKPIKLE